MYLKSEFLQEIGDEEGARVWLKKATALYRELVLPRDNAAEDGAGVGVEWGELGMNNFDGLVLLWSR
jgi:hypothetical protein